MIVRLNSANKAAIGEPGHALGEWHLLSRMTLAVHRKYGSRTT
jgi:hypothetical protein